MKGKGEKLNYIFRCSNSKRQVQYCALSLFPLLWKTTLYLILLFFLIDWKLVVFQRARYLEGMLEYSERKGSDFRGSSFTGRCDRQRTFQLAICL